MMSNIYQSVSAPHPPFFCWSQTQESLAIICAPQGHHYIWQSESLVLFLASWLCLNLGGSHPTHPRHVSFYWIRLLFLPEDKLCFSRAHCPKLIEERVLAAKPFCDRLRNSFLCGRCHCSMDKRTFERPQ